MSLIRRRIDVTITLGQGDFGEMASAPADGSATPSGAANTVTLQGLRVSAQITVAGAPGFNTAEITIWGMPPKQMNAVSRLGKPLQFFRNNTIALAAGDDDSGMAVVFNGVIQTAYQDLNQAPQAPIYITAMAGLISANRPVDPLSYPDQADAATVATTIAGNMQPPLQLENNGVSVQLSNPYFPGTARAQLDALAKAANFDWVIDDVKNVLAIWPKGGKRGGMAPEISADSGMIGYPTYSDRGIEVRTIFRTGLAFGSEIQVKSKALPGVTGAWVIYSLSHDLESEMPDGKWETVIGAYLPTDAIGTA